MLQDISALRWDFSLNPMDLASRILNPEADLAGNYLSRKEVVANSTTSGSEYGGFFPSIWQTLVCRPQGSFRVSSMGVFLALGLSGVNV